MALRYPDLAALVLRVGFSLYMIFGHGLSKFQNLISGEEIRFPELFGMPASVALSLAVFSEFIACIFIFVGYKTRLAAVPIVITMIIAAFYIHGSDAWFMKNAIDGKSKEFAMIYLFGFLGIFLLGPGKYSIDAKTKTIL